MSFSVGCERMTAQASAAALFAGRYKPVLD